jgi:hypothetical protein
MNTLAIIIAALCIATKKAQSVTIHVTESAIYREPAGALTIAG